MVKGGSLVEKNDIFDFLLRLFSTFFSLNKTNFCDFFCRFKL